jgi:hypothetical protein
VATRSPSTSCRSGRSPERTAGSVALYLGRQKLDKGRFFGIGQIAGIGQPKGGSKDVGQSRDKFSNECQRNEDRTKPRRAVLAMHPVKNVAGELGFGSLKFGRIRGIRNSARIYRRRLIPRALPFQEWICEEQSPDKPDQIG